MLALAEMTAPKSLPQLRERMAQLDPVQLVHALALGLDASWVAISAAFGLVVLLLVSVVRTKGS